MIILTIFLIVIYLFIAGMIGWRVYSTRGKRCSSALNKYPYNCNHLHATSAWLIGAFWPFAIPVIAGSLASNYLSTGDSRAEKKAERKALEHKNRLIELKAERELVREQKEKTMADIRFLAENGIKADVPGLYED